MSLDETKEDAWTHPQGCVTAEGEMAGGSYTPESTTDGEHPPRARGEAQKGPPLETSEGARPCQQLDLDPASGTARKYISVPSFKPPVCGPLFQQL